MGNRIIRNGEITHVSWYSEYVYEDRDGVQALVNLLHKVQMIVQVQDGPDAGREIRIVLDGEDVALHLGAVKEAHREATQKMIDDA